MKLKFWFLDKMRNCESWNFTNLLTSQIVSVENKQQEMQKTNKTCKNCCNWSNNSWKLRFISFGIGYWIWWARYRSCIKVTKLVFCPFFYVGIKVSWINWYSFVVCSVCNVLTYAISKYLSRSRWRPWCINSINLDWLANLLISLVIMNATQLCNLWHLGIWFGCDQKQKIQKNIADEPLHTNY